MCSPGPPLLLRKMPLTTLVNSLEHRAESFLYGFGKSAGVILASEIGDKTFFIAAVSVPCTEARSAPQPLTAEPAGDGHAQPSLDGLPGSDRGASGDDGAFSSPGLGGTQPGKLT